MSDDNKVDSISGVPAEDSILTFYNRVSSFMGQTPDWLPCNKAGCCTGDARCCREDMATSITWYEMEGIWNYVLKELPEAQRRAILAQAQGQMNAVFVANPGIIEKVESAQGTVTLGDIKQIEATLQTVEHVCPLLDQDPNSPTFNQCGVYAVRPLICRGFGQTVRMVPTGKLDENGKIEREPAWCGCDKTYAAAMEHPDVPHPNYSNLELALVEIVAPRVGAWRVPLVSKPIPAWIVDLADDDGDLTNPRDIFSIIRAMIVNAMVVNTRAQASGEHAPPGAVH